jgi:hypothetical protein
MIDEVFLYIDKGVKEHQHWCRQLLSLDPARANEIFISEARNIIERSDRFLENLKISAQDYQRRAIECVEEFEADNEFYLNKLHRLIAQRSLDYVFVMLQFHQHVFNDMNLTLSISLEKQLKKQGQKTKDNKRDIAVHVLRTLLSIAGPRDSEKDTTSTLETHSETLETHLDLQR